MRLSEQQSLEYLKEVGFPCSVATFYREKKKVEEMKLHRLYHIASIGFVDQHLDRIDNTELCLKLMWQNYHIERDPYKKCQILKDLIMVQPYLSSYYEATKLIIDKQQSEYQKFLDKKQSKQEITGSLQQLNEEDSINNDTDESFKQYDPNRKF